MKKIYAYLCTFLFCTVHSSSLGIFRIVLGLSLIYESHRIFSTYQSDYLNPSFLFKYDFFHFLQVLPESALLLLLSILLFSALCLVVGLFSQFASLLAFLSYGYFFLLDCSHYNNHYYLLLLILGLMIFIPSDKWASIRNLIPQFRHNSSSLPYWCIFVLKMQIVIAYFYGGLAKLHTDWLLGNVMRAVFEDKPQIIPNFLSFSLNTTVAFYTYGGLIFDLSIGFLLWYKSSRCIAMFLILFFHLTNAFSLDIGIFPYFMIAASVLFVETDKFAKWWAYLQKKVPNKRSNAITPFPVKNYVLVGITIYLAIQLIVPFRHYFIAGNVDWTGEGQFFSWRMKMPHKSLQQFEIYTFNSKTQEEYKPNISITDKQLNALIYYPTLILQFKEHIVQQLPENVSLEDIIITANVQVSMNGHQVQNVYDTKQNLASIHKKLSQKNNYIHAFQASNSR